jgi:lipid-binding SYLF domain-containing protein
MNQQEATGMNNYSRRGFLLLAAGGAATALAACDNGMASTGAGTIDARVDTTLNYLYSNYPGSRDLADKAVGMLVMPLVTEAGVVVGGAYGRGALRVGGATVDYYSQTKASVGIQFGAQQYAHVLFFMTEDALGEFRYSPGWVAGADVKYAVLNEGDRFSADTLSTTSPVIATVFGTSGLIVGATIEGTKYSRIIP